jgi:hypothetical protein
MVDTVRTVSNLLTAQFQDFQPGGTINPQHMRDLIVTLAAMAGLGASLTTAVAAGTSQGTATALSTYNSVINGGTGGVLLTNTTLVVQRVLNRSGAPIQVYPPSGVAIESQAVNGSVTLANGANLEISIVSSSVAYVVGGMGAPQINMPTTPTGLGSGCEWRNGTIVNIV